MSKDKRLKTCFAKNKVDMDTVLAQSQPSCKV